MCGRAGNRRKPGRREGGKVRKEQTGIVLEVLSKTKIH